MRRGKKKNVVIYLDSGIVKEAKELGLNISKICENALKEVIKRLKENIPQIFLILGNQIAVNPWRGPGGIRTRDPQLTKLVLQPG